MGQNLPFVQNQFQPAAGGTSPSAPVTGAPAAMPGMSSPLPGATASQFANVQQGLQNPNAGDGFNATQAQAPAQAGIPGMPGQAGAAPVPFENPMGDPVSLMIGGAAGIPISMAMQKLHGVEHQRIAGIASRIDNLPGVKQASSFLEQNVLSKWSGQAADNFLMRTAREKGPEAAVKAFQVHHIDEVLKPFGAENAKLLGTLQKAQTFDQFTAAADKKVLAMLRQAQKGGKLDAKTASKVAEVLKSGEVDNKVLALAKKVVGPEQKGALRVLSGVRARIHGLNTNFLPNFSDQAVLANKMKNVGPIGRAFASMSNQVRGMFGGETLKKGFNKGKSKVAEGAQKAAQGESTGILGKAMGPVLSGFITIGSALSKAKKAPQGEKISTFFHDFLGFGVGSLVGWQIGRNVLNKTNVLGKLFTKMGGVGKFLSVAKPLKFLSFIPGIGPALAGVGMAGLLTEVLAITVLSAPFKKAGEAIAHKVFGKPSQETLDKIEGKTKTDPATGAPIPANGMPQQTPAPAGQTFNRPGRFQAFKDQISGGAGAAPTVGAGAAAAPNFSLTPEQIMQSPAASQSQAEAASMMGSWGKNSMDPFGSH